MAARHLLRRSKETTTMRIGILGTGNMATALGQAWARAGHELVIAGRSTPRAGLVAKEIGGSVRAVAADRLAAESDVVVIAVLWEGLDDALALANAPTGAFAGKTVIDCTNAVDFSTGMLKSATSAAQHIAEIATGARVVKALHLFAGQSWLVADGSELKTVAICGDDNESLDITAGLIRDLGASTAVIGGLDHARQLEDVAGFVMAVVASGNNPASAVPSMA
ncbi:NAD(P)-binding domain-containing protein [Rhodococcus sp. ARC_M6]|uniref:NADPH-dependent F420 reductase n=1 Tax=Rhodococcus sp. ARC_M6 TaxID=2928852 RepID=UPI0027DECCF8|nr:NAD(P)-binding domain-containing protein [Rhodococcus sp. ARC_M6]